MSDREEKKKKLREAAQVSKQKADELLNDELEALKRLTQTDLEKLRPQLKDQATFDQLLAAVKESTQQNENLAQLKERLEGVGVQLIRVAKEAAKLLKYA